MEEKHVWVEVPDDERLWRQWEGFASVLRVIVLGNGIYRLKDVSAFSPLQYGDEFEADSIARRSDDYETLVVRRRVTKSGYRRWTTIGHRQYLDQPGVVAALEELEAAGGYWITELGGAFTATWPPGFDFEDLLRRAFPDDNS